MRQAVVADRFYAKDKDKLLQQIKKCTASTFFKSDKKVSRKILGAISPHAGYMASGPGAALVYDSIKQNRTVETFIILAPNHTGRGRTSLIKESYWTPLGEGKVDVALADQILEKTDIVEDMASHVFEHSLEVQIPFIKYYFPDSKIVPVVVSSLRNAKAIGDSLSKIINFDRHCVIASSDFTHYGYEYGYTPYENDFRKQIKNMDLKAISFIEKADAEGFLNFVTENNMTICGYLPIYVMIWAIRKYMAVIMNYYSSSDILRGREDSSVSYLSLVLEQPQ
jgi:MEMO1 family protein